MVFNPTFEFTDDANIAIPALNNNNIKFYVQKWIDFFFTVPKKHHPKFHHQPTPDFSDDLDKDQVGYQNTIPAADRKVWYLLDANMDGFFTTVLPDNQQWASLVVEYITMASPAEFTSLTPGQLASLVTNDTGAVSSLEARIDSHLLVPIYIPHDQATGVNIKQGNVLGIPQANNVTVDYSAYVTMLKPLEPGDHVIVSKAESPNYKTNVEYSLAVRL
jgi:hypothetical protein